MWLFRELSAPYLFLAAQWNPHIRWRTNEFRLLWGGLAEVIGKAKAPGHNKDGNVVGL